MPINQTPYVPLVLLAKVVLFAQVGEVDNRLGCDKMQSVDNINFLVGPNTVTNIFLVVLNPFVDLVNDFLQIHMMVNITTPFCLELDGFELTYSSFLALSAALPPVPRRRTSFSRSATCFDKNSSSFNRSSSRIISTSRSGSSSPSTWMTSGSSKARTTW